MLKHHVQNIDLMLKHHPQNIDAMLKCSAHTYFSKAETFIILNFKMWLLYTELSITAGQQAISSIPILAYRKHCILVQQRLDVLVTFTNSVLHCSVPSEFMSQASKLVRLRHLEGSNQGTNFAD